MLASCRQSLKDLRQDYLTSIWCIGPFPIIMRPAVPATPGTPDSRPFRVQEFMKVWAQCEELAGAGLHGTSACPT